MIQGVIMLKLHDRPGLLYLQPMSNTPEISVIIPYFNEKKTIRKTLEMVAQQTLKPVEALFVDSGSTDGCHDEITKWIETEGAKTGIHFQNFRAMTAVPSNSKNYGVEKSKCEFVAFMDCGLLFSAQWLEIQWGYLVRDSADVVSGVCFLEGVGALDRAAVAQTYGYRRARPAVPGTLVRKSVFKKTGPFLVDRRAGYDYAWLQKLNKLKIKRVVHEQTVVQYNGFNYANSFSLLFKKSIRYAAPCVNMEGYYIPYYYLALFVLGIVVVALKPEVFLPLSIAYIMARGLLIPYKKSRGFAVWRSNPAVILYMPVVGLVMDAGKIIGYIKGLFGSYKFLNEVKT